MRKLYLTAKDVSKILGISVSWSYVIIRQCNEELQKMGFQSIAGKVCSKYFYEKYYGYNEEEIEKVS